MIDEGNELLADKVNPVLAAAQIVTAAALPANFLFDFVRLSF